MKIEEYKQLSEAILIIDSASTRGEAYQALQPLKLAQLKAIAAHYKAHTMRPTKPILTDKIINQTVGNRLKFEAIRSLSLN